MLFSIQQHLNICQIIPGNKLRNLAKQNQFNCYTKAWSLSQAVNPPTRHKYNIYKLLKAIFNHSNEALIKHLNETNSNIIVPGVYVQKKKCYTENGIKKTILVYKNITKSILFYRIKIFGCFMEPDTIKQGYYLKSPQFSYCFKFHEENQRCPANKHTCPNCAGQHRRYECDSHVI